MLKGRAVPGAASIKPLASAPPAPPPSLSALSAADDEERDSKRQKLCVQLEAGEMALTSSFLDAKTHAVYDPGKQTLSLSTASDSTNAFVSYEVKIKPLLGRIGMKISLCGTASESAHSIKLARQLSSSPSDESTVVATSTPDESSDAALSIADVVKRELARAHAYAMPIHFAAKHPETKEFAEYAIVLLTPTGNATRTDVKITCVETKKVKMAYLYTDLIVKRILLVSGIGGNESVKDAFTPSAIRDDTNASEEEPFKIRLAASGTVTVLVQLPDDEFTEGAAIFAPVLKLHMLK